MKKMKGKETILTAAIGGIILFVATIILSSFLSSPPSRAEFDSFKATIGEKGNSIDRRLNNLETGQTTIINMMLQKGVTHDRKHKRNR